jgi:hypothetical protein
MFAPFGLWRLVNNVQLTTKVMGGLAYRVRELTNFLHLLGCE